MMVKLGITKMALKSTTKSTSKQAKNPSNPNERTYLRVRIIQERLSPSLSVCNKSGDNIQLWPVNILLLIFFLKMFKIFLVSFK